MKDKKLFKARLLQMQIEMEAWKARVASYEARETKDPEGLLEAARHLEALARGIDNLINEHAVPQVPDPLDEHRLVLQHAWDNNSIMVVHGSGNEKQVMESFFKLIKIGQ